MIHAELKPGKLIRMLSNGWAGLQKGDVVMLVDYQNPRVMNCLGPNGRMYVICTDYFSPGGFDGQEPSALLELIL